MKHLAIIPARSGSKGLRDKNILPLAGKPLMAHSIQAALSAGLFDTVHVSTDSERYAEIARQYGADVPFLRYAETATDAASSWSVVLEALERYERMGKTYDTVTLLQPTSPLRTAADIQAAFQHMHACDAQSVIAVCEAEDPPLWCNTLPENTCMEGFIPTAVTRLGNRQNLPSYYRINGALYLLTVPALQTQRRILYNSACYAYIMPTIRSVDIDTELDFLIAEAILQHMSSASETGSGKSKNI